MKIAITRRVSPAIEHCELTHLESSPIDLERARAQHQQYEDALRSLGVKVESLPADQELPDSVFVEDTALVLDECAVLTRPGAESRRQEVAVVEAALKPHRRLLCIEPPATLDGGDILVAGRVVYVGLTSRSNRAAVEQLSDLLAPFGYATRSVAVNGCLHLKSAVTRVGTGMLLLNPEWVDPAEFDGWTLIEVDPAEPYAANAMLVGETIIYPTSFPATRMRLEAAGIAIQAVEADELAKAEGAVTCCSLLFEGRK